MNFNLNLFKHKLFNTKALIISSRRTIKKYFKKKLLKKKKFFFKITRKTNNSRQKRFKKKKLISFYYKHFNKIIVNLKLINSAFSQKYKIFNLAKQKNFITSFLRRKQKLHRFKRTRKFGYLQFKKSFNNLFISIHDRKNKLLFSSSICALAEKSRDRFSSLNMRLAGEKLAEILQRFKLFKIEIHPYCRLHKGLRNLLWVLKSKKIKIFRIIDLVRTPHGFMTLPSRRRIKRRG